MQGLLDVTPLIFHLGIQCGQPPISGSLSFKTSPLKQLLSTFIDANHAESPHPMPCNANTVSTRL